MPAVWLMLVVVVLMTAVGLVHESMWAEVATLFYVRNWFSMFSYTHASPTVPTWSLAVEEQFYLLWPVIFVVAHRHLTRLGVARLALGGAVVAAVNTAILVNYTSWNRATEGLDARPAISLLVGAALGASRIVRVPRLAARTSASLLVLAPLLHASHEFWGHIGFTLVAICTAAVIVEVTRAGSTLGRLLGWGPLVYVGTISYSIYLWHYPMLMLARESIVDADARVSASAAVAVLLTAVVAPASYHFVEQPWRKWGRLWLERSVATRRDDRSSSTSAIS